MSTYTTKLNANVVFTNVTNDNTLTNLLVIDASGNVKYRTVSSLGTANQALNTTSNVQFNTVTTPLLTGPSNTLYLVNNNISYIYASASTTNNTQTIYTINTSNNYSYLVIIEIAATSTSGVGAAAYYYTRRVTNASGTITSGNVETYSNTTLSFGVTVNLSVSGSGYVITVGSVGVPGTVDWTLFLRIRAVS